MYIMTKNGWKSLGGLAERFHTEAVSKRMEMRIAKAAAKAARDAFLVATRDKQPIEVLRMLSREATAASLAYQKM